MDFRQQSQERFVRGFQAGGRQKVDVCILHRSNVKGFGAPGRCWKARLQSYRVKLVIQSDGRIKIKIRFLKIHDCADYATSLSFVFLPSDKVQNIVKVHLNVTCRCSTHRLC